MSDKSLSVETSNYSITGGSRGATIEVYDCGVDDIIEYYGKDLILDSIGLREVKEYFNLTDKEE